MAEITIKLGKVNEIYVRRIPVYLQYDGAVYTALIIHTQKDCIVRFGKKTPQKVIKKAHEITKIYLDLMKIEQEKNALPA